MREVMRTEKIFSGNWPAAEITELVAMWPTQKAFCKENGFSVTTIREWCDPTHPRKPSHSKKLHLSLIAQARGLLAQKVEMAENIIEIPPSYWKKVEEIANGHKAEPLAVVCRAIEIYHLTKKDSKFL